MTANLSRRGFLRSLAAAGSFASAGAIVSACDSGPLGGGSGITLRLADWPYQPMPSAEDQDANPTTKAYAEALQTWLDENPDVTIQGINFDVWDQDALNTSVAGGTAPAMFPGNVLGGWDNAQTRSAFKQGLAADVTDFVETYGFSDKIADYALPIWETWEVDGHYYGLPQGYNVGNGLYYRRDLLSERDVAEPEPEWTWEDAREITAALTDDDHHGIAFQQWGIGWPLGAEGFGLLTQVPAPEEAWRWQWDYTTYAQTWVEVVELFRAMVYEDESVFSDITFTDTEVNEAFSQGRAAMMGNNAGFFTQDPDSETSPAYLARQMDKPIGEVFAWISHPTGSLGQFGNTQAFMTILSFSPDLSEDQLDMVSSLHDWMVFGEAYTLQKQALWEATEDPQKVHTTPTPLNGMQQIDGIPGDAEEAWGPEYVQAVRAAAEIPLVPNPANFLPTEESAGPDSTPVDDAYSRWSYEEANVNIAADLADLENTRNQQAASFSSSISEEDFRAAAAAYFAAHDEFWQAHAPEFHREVFQDWYQSVALPRLS